MSLEYVRWKVSQYIKMKEYNKKFDQENYHIYKMKFPTCAPGGQSQTTHIDENAIECL